MVSIDFFPPLKLALLVVGGVAVVYLAVRAITNKKPGAAGTVLFGLLALLLGFALFGVGLSVFVPVLHEVKTQSVSTVGGTYTVVQHGQGRLALITWPVIVAVVVGGLWVVSRMRQSSLRGEGHGGWGLPLLVLVALVLVGLNVRWVRNHGQALPPQSGAIVPMEQLFDQMNKPRIQIAPNTPPQPNTPSPPISSETPREVSPETDRLLVDMAKRIDALARQLAVRRDTDKMLADMATRIDVLARQSAVIAEKLSETMNSTGDSSPPQTAATETTTTASRNAPPDGQHAGGSPSARPQPPAARPQPLAADSSATAATGVVADAADAAVKLVTSTTEATTSDAAAAATSAEPRPAWVDDPPRRVGNIQREVIAAGEYETVEECYRAADIYLLFATYDYLMQLEGTPQVTSATHPSLLLDNRNVFADGAYIIIDGRPVDYRLSTLARMGIGIDYIRHEIAKKEYVETTQRSVGPMKTLYTQVEFSPSIDRELRQRWDASQREERFAVVGVIAGSVLGLVGAVFGLLKIDTWTKGYYTKRLFLGVPAVIIGLVVLLVFLG